MMRCDQLLSSNTVAGANIGCSASSLFRLAASVSAASRGGMSGRVSDPLNDLKHFREYWGNVFIFFIFDPTVLSASQPAGRTDGLIGRGREGECADWSVFENIKANFVKKESIPPLEGERAQPF